MTVKHYALFLLTILTLAGCGPSPRVTAYQDYELYEGYPCVPHCDAFQAGYDNARAHHYKELSSCGQDLTPQVTGCKAYVTEYQLEKKEGDLIRQELSTP